MQTGAGYYSPSKLKDGETFHFCFVDRKQILTAWECWGEDKEGKAKPFRFLDKPQDAEIKAEMEAAGFRRKANFKGDGVDIPKLSIYAPVYNFTKNEICILSIGQKQLIQQLHEISEKKAYATLTNCEFELVRHGLQLDTTYTIVPLPHDPDTIDTVTDAWAALSPTFDIRRLLVMGDPYKEDGDA
jgi:hypothetical protein